MFVQVIQGKVSDREAYQRQVERWREELKPGAKGYLGSTAGITGDDELVAVVRFESQDDARANSDRPEQDSWWQETKKLFDGEPTFRNCSDVSTFLRGGSDDAGFVQVIQATVNNRQRMEELDAETMDDLAESRPDLIGGLTAWDGDFMTQFAYFLSEHAAREGESQAMSPETQAVFSEWQSLMDDVKYHDLREPWLDSP